MVSIEPKVRVVRRQQQPPQFAGGGRLLVVTHWCGICRPPPWPRSNARSAFHPGRNGAVVHLGPPVPTVAVRSCESKPPDAIDPPSEISYANRGRAHRVVAKALAHRLADDIDQLRRISGDQEPSSAA
jgi:hypothetical protein